MSPATERDVDHSRSPGDRYLEEFASARAMVASDPEGALAVLERLAAEQPELPNALALAARVLRTQLRFSESLDMWRRLLQIRPNHDVGLEQVAELDRLESRYPQLPVRDGLADEVALDSALIESLTEEASWLATASGCDRRSVTSDASTLPSGTSPAGAASLTGGTSVPGGEEGPWLVVCADAAIGGHSGRVINILHALGQNVTELHAAIGAHPDSRGSVERVEEMAAHAHAVHLWGRPQPDRESHADRRPDSAEHSVLLLDELLRRQDPARLAETICAVRPRHVLISGDPVVMACAGLVATACGVPDIHISSGSIAPVERSDSAMRANRNCHAVTGQILRHLARDERVSFSGSSRAGLESNLRWLGEFHRSTVLRNPEDIDGLRERRNSVAEPTPWPPGARVVGTAFRIAAVKRPQLFAEVARRVTRIRDDVHFVVLGEGDRGLFGDVDDLAGRLHLMGQQTRPEPWIARMDVVLVTSESEGGAGIVLEAQAIGRPVVVAKVGGACESFVDGQTGLIVDEIDDPDAYTDAVLRILDDPSFATAASRYGPDLIRREHNPTTFITGLKAVTR